MLYTLLPLYPMRPPARVAYALRTRALFWANFPLPRRAALAATSLTAKYRNRYIRLHAQLYRHFAAATPVRETIIVVIIITVLRAERAPVLAARRCLN